MSEGGRNVRNLKTEAHIELKTANREWADCVSNNFLPQWLQGAKLNVEEVCSSQKTRMEAANEALYGENHLPIKMFELPTAPQ